uniref:Uncharacterized protein n=1 Tax=Rhizophora mucronata TaxID=61149 RepID=A0A2P2PRD2_RHIMU
MMCYKDVKLSCHRKPPFPIMFKVFEARWHWQKSGR